MKTYTKTIEAPQLEIRYDSMADNPRSFDINIGYFITCEKNRNSPDSHDDLESMIKTTGEEAKSVAEHIQLIREGVKAVTGEDVFYITPVYRYEHGNVVYRRGEAHGFDVSNCGFYIVTTQILERAGLSKATKEELEKMIDAELEVYTAWANGEVYMFKLYDETTGGMEHFSGGFYSLDDIKAELGEEWKDEDLSKYLITK